GCGYSVEKVQGCAHEFLSAYSFSGRELVYCDPPYLHYTRTSKRRYRFDYTEQDHIELLDLLKKIPCSVMLSGYPSALYDEILTDWGSLELQVMNRGGSGPRSFGSTLPLAGYTGPVMQAKTLQIGSASSARRKPGGGAIKHFLAQSVWPFLPPSWLSRPWKR
ncbi:MAG: hypothetical protein ACNA8H_13155, partial [Anaerolineales bacterium]